MKDIDKLEPYIEHPLDSTILVVSYKDKKVDGRSKLAKILKQNAQLITTKSFLITSCLTGPITMYNPWVTRSARKR